MLHTDERLDDLQYNGLKIIQHPQKYCFTSDAVLLANAVNANKNQKVIDIGCGSGVISILVAAKTGASVVGVEILDDMADMAARSVELNGMGSQVSILSQDVRLLGNQYNQCADVVVSNPPYRKLHTGQISDDAYTATARSEINLKLDELLECAQRLLKSKGRFYMIHRTDRLADIIYHMRSCKIEPKKLIFYYSGNKNSEIVLVEGIKDGGCELCVQHIQRQF